MRQAPNAGSSNPPVGSGKGRVRGIRRVTGSVYRNGRSGGFGALQAPATNHKLHKNSRLDLIARVPNVTCLVPFSSHFAEGCSLEAFSLNRIPTTMLVHEIDHEMLHRGDRRILTTKQVRETEAEAVAFVVCQSVGLQNGTASQDYIQLWHGDANLLRESLEAVQQTAAVILGGIAPEPAALAAAA